MSTEKIEQELMGLVGTHAARLGRSAGMLWFGFGDDVEIIVKQKPKTVSRFALHVQCPWRIVDNGNVIVASSDIYYPPDGEYHRDFEWDIQGANRFDVHAVELNRLFSDHPMMVAQVVADAYGGIEIVFDNNLRFEIFPNSSFRHEFWRFIIFSSKREEEKHFVVFEEDEEEASQ